MTICMYQYEDTKHHIGSRLKCYMSTERTRSKVVVVKVVVVVVVVAAGVVAASAAAAAVAAAAAAVVSGRVKTFIIHLL